MTELKTKTNKRNKKTSSPDLCRLALCHGTSSELRKACTEPKEKPKVKP